MGLSNIPSVANGSIPVNGSVENLTQQALAQTADVLFSSVFSKIVWAFVILIMSLVIGKIVEKALLRFLSEFQINDAAERVLSVPVKFDALISGIIGKAIYVVGILLALSVLSLTGIVLNTIAIVVMVLVIILVFLGLKDFVPNSLAGLLLHAKRSIHVGDEVCVDRLCGTVQAFELLETRIVTKKGDIVHIPNVYFFSRKVRIVYKQHKKVSKKKSK